MTVTPTTAPTVRINRRKPFNWGKLGVHLILAVIGLACVIPMILVISISLSDDRELALNGYSLLPVGFSTFAYEYILQQPGQILQAYGVTIFITAVGTVVGLLLCAMLGYAISRQDYLLPGRCRSMFFTLLFNGGMVPFTFWSPVIWG
ncbi:MAG: hypothetical protein R2932_27775 [Caldilineaceae bacterium]